MLTASVPRSSQTADELVGRDDPLAALDGVLAAARGGRGRVVLVAGEPGIGKTRLAEEAARRAAAAGMRVAWGRCHEGDGAPALWPWAQVARQLSVGLAPGQLAATLGPSAAWLGPLLPELAEPSPPAGPPPIADLGAARFQLNQAVAGLLRRLAEARPLLIVVDDLHWADVPSLSLLASLAAELQDARLAVVCTYRDVEVLAAPAAGRHARRAGPRARGGADPAGRSGKVRRGPADRPHHRRQAGRAAGGRRCRPVRRQPVLHHRTAAPAAKRAQAGRAGRDDGGAALHSGGGAGAPLCRRLARLPAQTSTVLMIAAVAGRRVRPGPDRGGDRAGRRTRALDAAEAAVLAGLVIEDDRAAGRYRFAHALVRETIYKDISRARRARLHARVVDALVAARGAEPEPAAEMADHCWQAAPVIGAGRALPHLLRAGEQAIAQLAYEAADEQFERALELAGQLPASPQAAEQEIHIAARLGTVRLVMRGVRRPRCGPGPGAGPVAGGAGRPAGRARRRPVGAVRVPPAPLGNSAGRGVRRRAAVALGSERNDPDLLSAGHWQVGTVALHRGDLQEAQHHLERALAASRDIAPGMPGDAPVDLTLVCQGALGVARAYQGHRQAALRLTRQAVGSARRLGDPLGLVCVLFCDAWAATIAEATTRVLDSRPRQRRLAASTGSGWGIPTQFFHGWAEARSGDPRRGEQRIRAALAEMDATGTPMFRPFALGLLAEAQLLAGRPAQAGETPPAPGHPGGRPAG